MLFRVKPNEDKHPEFQPYPRRSAAELGLLEKDLENWIASHPELLFGVERILVIARSVSGQSMADILALDGEGRLVLVEMKRDWSDRSTVGQLLEYAARMAESSYSELEGFARRFWGSSQASLIEKFREFVDDQSIGKESIGQKQRLVVVAPGSDNELRRIVSWLKRCGVSIEFVPFTLYCGGESKEIFIEIEPLSRPSFAAEPLISGTGTTGWRGDWFFNTNETYASGAYTKMFDQNVIAIYGYETGPENLMGSKTGQRVFAYVNRKGIMAVGQVVDGTVFPARSVFNQEGEFHVRVNWQRIVTDAGVTNREVREVHGYSLPVRSVFCGLNRPDIADWLADRLRERAPLRPPIGDGAS